MKRTTLVVLSALLVSGTAGAQARTQGRPLTLEEAFQLAERTSEAVNIAAAGVKRAEGQQAQARSAYLPQLNGTLAYQRTLQSQFQKIAAASSGSSSGGSGNGTDSSSSGGNSFGGITRIFASPNTITLGLSGSQTLFSGGRVGAQNRAAASGVRAANIGVNSAKAQLRLDVAGAYYDASLTDRLVAIAESSLVQSERTFRQTSLARQVGNVAEFDLIRARVARDNLKPTVIQARSQRDVAYLRLRQLLHVPLTEPVALTSDILQGLPQPDVRTASNDNGARIAPVSRINENVEAILAEDPAVEQSVASMLASTDTAVDVRAPVRQAREAVSVSEQQLRIARAQRLPSLAVTTNYQRFNYPSSPGDVTWSNSFPNWTVGVGLSVPLFTGGRIKGDEMVAQAGVIEAQQRLEQARNFASLDARLAVAELAQAEAAYLASAGTDLQAARAYSIAEVRFSEGISTQVELSEARIQLNQAQANRALAARNLQVARVKLGLLRDLPLGSSSGSSQGASQSQQQSSQQQATQARTQSTQAAQQGQAGSFQQ